MHAICGKILWYASNETLHWHKHSTMQRSGDDNSKNIADNGGSCGVTSITPQ